MKELRAMSPGKLGSGCNLNAIRKAMEFNPDFIGVDAGSTDPGAFYIGSGRPFYTPRNIKKDLRSLLLAARSKKIPLIVGNAITTGTNALLDQGVQMLKEVCKEEGISVRVAVIRSEQSKEYLKSQLKTETIKPLGAREDLTEGDIDKAAVILGQMGVEPIAKALDMGVDVVFAARACDDAIFAALPVLKGYEMGLALHMGKILECGSMSCIPNDLHGSLIAHLREDHFVLEPPEEHRICTVQSVAAHTLYERDDPYWQLGPGGANDLKDSKFEQLGERCVKVSGSTWVKDDIYKVRLEGVCFAGYRTICITGVRDPILIGCLDKVLNQTIEEVEARFGISKGEYQVIFRKYGQDAVMGPLEPERGDLPHEIGLLCEVLAETQELADSVCTFARGSIQHAYFPGIIATAGNMAYPFSPFTIPCGEVFHFSIDHLIPVKDPCSMFPITIEQIG